MRGALIGLYDPQGGGAISLEPGGQFEFPARRSTTRTRPGPNWTLISRRLCPYARTWESVFSTSA